MAATYASARSRDSVLSTPALTSPDSAGSGSMSRATR